MQGPEDTLGELQCLETLRGVCNAQDQTGALCGKLCTSESGLASHLYLEVL